MVSDSILAPGVRIGEGASIGPDAVIGEGARVEAGDGARGRGEAGAGASSSLEPRNDRSNQLDDVLALPDHLRDALWRVESARIEPFDAPGGLVVCGMGGSAIGGDLAAVAFGNRLSRPLTTERGYELPFAMLPDRAVLCSSYSGDTEETLACYEAAEALGARRIVATTGGRLAEAARADGVPVIGLPAGLQPRAAVGYMFTVAAEVAALAGAAPGIRTEIDSAGGASEGGRAGPRGARGRARRAARRAPSR